MYIKTAAFHEERMNNENLVPPPNATEIDVEIVKD
jgi:hypothetical protein